MKRNGLLTLLVIGLAAFCTPTNAAYVFQYLHGNSCTSITPGATPTFTEWGPSNPTNSAITVQCPISPASVSGIKNIWYSVWGWSRNNAKKLSCSVTTTAMMGGVSATSTATFPYNVGAAGLVNATTIPQPNYTPIPYMTCYIPPMENGWVSYLSTIQIRYEY